MHRLVPLLVLVVALAGLAGAGRLPGASAQDEPTDEAIETTGPGTPEPEAVQPAPPRLAVGLHRGACLAVEPPPLYGLTDVAAVAAPAGAVAATPGAGAEAVAPRSLLVSVTTLDVPFAELIETRWALVVEDVACGDNASTLRPVAQAGPGEEAVVLLSELNGSGYAGTAWLHEAAAGQTVVVVVVAEGLAAPAGATPIP